MEILVIVLEFVKSKLERYNTITEKFIDLEIYRMLKKDWNKLP
jgi:hypothetical protein